MAGDLAAVEAGLDALSGPQPPAVRQRWRRLASQVVPPVVALLLALGVWQLLWASAIWAEYVLPSPGQVWDTATKLLLDGTIGEAVWTSMSRAVLGFAAAVVIAVPLGVLVAKVRVVRSSIGSPLTGLQAMPSVAWVPAAVIWFGLNDAAIYLVILLGAVPSIAVGLMSGLDQIPPLWTRVGYTLGAGRLAQIRHILLPASLPGFLLGLKQGWAFSWRSLMAAELIARSPELGTGVGQLLEDGRLLGDMPRIMTAMALILLIGIGIELLVFQPVERRVLTARGLGGR
jgi:NitT/TauT family transport system permease protein